MRFQDTHHLEVDAFAELGTFPVFEHLTSTTMSGTNPDGRTTTTRA